jgi:DNA-binding MarR family transcriptional regulator
MALARETVELLIQAARATYFEDDRRGLRDREWMALRFLWRANRFSRTPSALADFIGTTRATASQIAKILEEKSYVVRVPSQLDRRSVTLRVTSQGERLLIQHDPINDVLNAVAALVPEDCTRLRDALNNILNRIEKGHRQADTGICRDCIFLARDDSQARTGRARTGSEFLCRFHRAPIAADELELICTSFERVRDRLEIG